MSGLPAVSAGYDSGMAKNPFMSAYLSAANRAANTVRVRATSAVKAETTRQRRKATRSATSAWVDMWTGGAGTRKRRKR